MRYVPACLISDLANDEMLGLEIEQRLIVVARVADTIYAVDGICSHALGYLDQGELEGLEIVCPLHGGRFDLRTGEPVAKPAQIPIKSYAVRVEGDQILVGVETENAVGRRDL